MSLQTIRFPTVDDIENEAGVIESEIRGYESVSPEDLSDVESMDSDNETIDPTYNEEEDEDDGPVWIHRDYDVISYDCRVASNVFEFLGGECGGSGIRPSDKMNNKRKSKIEEPACKKKKKGKKGQETFVYRDLELF